MNCYLLTATCYLILLVSAIGPTASAKADRNDNPHDYHVCITQVDYNPNRAALEISVKLFADDIEKAITKLGGPPMHLGEAREVVGTDSLLSMYLRHKLTFAVDGKVHTWHWVGHEAELDEVWCYLEITGIDELPSLQVTNGILTEVYEDQSNAVHVRVGPTTKSLFFNRNILKGSLSF